MLSVALGIVLALAIVELGDAVLYRIATRRWIWLQGPAPLPARAIQALPGAYHIGTYRHQLHPYYGFTGRPGQRMRDIAARDVIAKLIGEKFAEARWPVLVMNNAGFWCEHDYPFSYDPTNTFVIGVFGGSVAQQFGMTMDETLRETLASHPRVAHKRLIVINFCNGGAKQPQQLCALSYFLALGQRFDAVVNLDGFNELFIGWYNVNEHQTRIEMPFGRYINGIQTIAIDTALVAAAEPIQLALRRLDERRTAARSSIQRRVLEWLMDAKWAQLQGLERQMTHLNPGRLKDLPLPLPSADPAVDYVHEVAKQWCDASLAMHHLARGFGIPYVHVLQPNQYFRHEQFTEAERATFLNCTNPPIAEMLPPVYRAYLAHADALRAAGIEFFDATGIFEGRNFFYDHACHITFEGNRILAAAIGARIAALLPADTPVPATRL